MLPPILELGLPYIVKHVPQQANSGKWRLLVDQAGRNDQGARTTILSRLIVNPLFLREVDGLNRGSHEELQSFPKTLKASDSTTTNR